MENQHPANATTVLAANDEYPLLRKAVRRFRQACHENPHARWLQPKQLLSKAARTLSLPLSWTVTLRDRGSLSVTLDAIIGFKVAGSVDRILLLSVDYGYLPIHRADGDSIFLRTQALVKAWETDGMPELRPSHKIVAWIMQSSKRVEEFSRLCAEQGLSGVCLIDEETFFSSPDVLAIKWHMPDQSAHSLI